VLPGEQIRVAGHGFRAGARVRLVLAGRLLRRLRVGPRGRFRVRVWIPRGLAAGRYRLAARSRGAVVRRRLRVLARRRLSQPLPNLVPSPPPSAPPPARAGRFPRLMMTHYLVDSTTEAQSLARWDWVVVSGQHIGSVGSGIGTDTWDDMRAVNRNILIMAYIDGSEDNANLNNQLRCRSPNQLVSGFTEEWWLKNADGTFAGYNGSSRKMINPTAFVPTNGAGRRWNEHLANWLATCYQQDGVLVDMVSDSACGCWPGWTITSRVPDIDMDRNGVRDVAEHGEAWTNNTWGAAMRDLMAKARAALGPGDILVGNNGIGFNQWANGQSLEAGHGTAPDVNGLNLFASWQQNHFGDLWGTVQIGGSQTDYRLMRRGLTAAMMHDYHFSYSCGANCNFTSLWWYDEYSVDLATGRATRDASRKGYLGSPIGPALTLANGVRRRDFDNGVALVNMTNSSQTVALGGTFRRIQGTQDPVVNNGQSVSSVTLAGQDGLIVLR